jgi:hypothetical protein
MLSFLPPRVPDPGACLMGLILDSSVRRTLNVQPEELDSESEGVAAAVCRWAARVRARNEEVRRTSWVIKFTLAVSSTSMSFSPRWRVL